MPRKTSSRDDTGQPIPLKTLPVDLASERRAYEQAGTRGEREGELEAASVVFHTTSIGNRTFDVPSAAEVYSDQVFEVKMHSSSVHKFTAALKIHWALVSMAAISGAADAVEHGWREPSPKVLDRVSLDREFEELRSRWHEVTDDEVTEDELMEEEEEGEDDEPALTCPRCQYRIPRHTVQ